MYYEQFIIDFLNGYILQYLLYKMGQHGSKC